jgi:hypothetical protein
MEPLCCRVFSAQKKRENKCNSINLPVSTQSWTTDRYPIVLQIPKGLKGISIFLNAAKIKSVLSVQVENGFQIYRMPFLLQRDK